MSDTNSKCGFDPDQMHHSENQPCGDDECSDCDGRDYHPGRVEVLDRGKRHYVRPELTVVITDVGTVAGVTTDQGYEYDYEALDFDPVAHRDTAREIIEADHLADRGATAKSWDQGICTAGHDGAPEPEGRSHVYVAFTGQMIEKIIAHKLGEECPGCGDEHGPHDPFELCVVTPTSARHRA